MILLTVRSGNCCLTIRLRIVLMSRHACAQPTAAIPRKRHRVLPAALSEEHTDTGVPLERGDTKLILETWGARTQAMSDYRMASARWGTYRSDEHDSWSALLIEKFIINLARLI